MKLLADRQSNGIAVSLFWDPTAAPDHDVVIEYLDPREGLAYTFRPPSKQALDAFYHPNCYLDRAVPVVLASRPASLTE